MNIKIIIIKLTIESYEQNTIYVIGTHSNRICFLTNTTIKIKNFLVKFKLYFIIQSQLRYTCGYCGKTI